MKPINIIHNKTIEEFYTQCAAQKIVVVIIAYLHSRRIGGWNVFCDVILVFPSIID